MRAFPRSERRLEGMLGRFYGQSQSFFVLSELETESCRSRSAFTHVLRKDQELHGVEDYTVQDDVLDDFQQEVDDIIDASILDAATSSGVSSSGPRLSSATAASTADAEPEG